LTIQGSDLIIKRLYQIIENGYNLVEHIGRQKMTKAEVNLNVSAEVSITK
jgi:predicted ATP-dependent Lon-type protease